MQTLLGGPHIVAHVEHTIQKGDPGWETGPVLSNGECY